MGVKSILSVTVIALTIFASGAATARYELFPFSLMRAGYNYFRPSPQFSSSMQSGQGDYRVRAPLFETFPGRADLVMLGDSITALAQWDDIFPGKAIANRGISGDTIEGILARLQAVIQMKPQKVFIMAGINDLIRGSRAKNVLSVYTDAVRVLRSAGPQVFVQSTLLTAANYAPVINSEVRKLNDGLRKLCSVGHVCTFIDLNARLAPDGYLHLTRDGVHLSPAGYAEWRDEIAQILTD
jgi:lysophospholipase L1-like esterase